MNSAGLPIIPPEDLEEIDGGSRWRIRFCPKPKPKTVKISETTKLSKWDPKKVPSHGILNTGSDGMLRLRHHVRFSLTPEAVLREERPYRENYAKNEGARRKQKYAALKDVDTSNPFEEDFTLKNMDKLIQLLRMTSCIINFDYPAIVTVENRIFRFAPKYQDLYKKKLRPGPNFKIVRFIPMRRRRELKITP